MLIVNDFEIGAVADIETRDASGAQPESDRAALSTRRCRSGAMRLVVAHFPEGAIAATRDGGRFAAGLGGDAARSRSPASTARATLSPPACSTAVHEGWPIEEGLRLGHACAAASMREVSTTAGVAPVAECLALAEKWGLRPAPA